MLLLSYYPGEAPSRPENRPKTITRGRPRNPGTDCPPAPGPVSLKAIGGAFEAPLLWISPSGQTRRLPCRPYSRGLGLGVGAVSPIIIGPRALTFSYARVAIGSMPVVNGALLGVALDAVAALVVSAQSH